jgi:hypothetical protein
MTTRFTDWEPVPGDAALVPGGPASASYVSVLTDDDIAAIQAGHRGYAPLRFFVTAKKPTSGGRIQRGDALELVYYDAGAWQVSGVFRRWNRLDAVLSDIRREHGLKRGDYALTVLPQENL